MKTTPRLSLPRAADRIGILSFEHTRLHQRGSVLVATTNTTDYAIPTAQLTAILAGPGTSITHAAATLLADNAVTLCWTGQGAIRAYGSITPLAVQADLLHRQIECWSDPARRLNAAIIAYKRRFPTAPATDTPDLTTLRAAEGRRVKRLYRQHSVNEGIPWPGRRAQWEIADPLNRAITAAYHCFYGAAANIITALGCHPSLGFIHTGKRDAFVYDIADIHKLSIGLPVAFHAAKDNAPEQVIRHTINVEIRKHRTLSRMVDDVYNILGITTPTVELLYLDDLRLYDPAGDVQARTNWA